MCTSSLWSRYKVLLPHMCRQMQSLDEREQQLRALTASQDRSERLLTAERGQTSKTLHQMRQQLHHERRLKREAFHTVDDLLSKVSRGGTEGLLKRQTEGERVSLL